MRTYSALKRALGLNRHSASFDSALRDTLPKKIQEMLVQAKSRRIDVSSIIGTGTDYAALSRGKRARID